jgi:peptidoglycan/LPS O-acetylase OafA/YrhL
MCRQWSNSTAWAQGNRFLKSISGQYYEKLDHIRALAAFSVFVWHALPWWVPRDRVPKEPFASFLDEGHFGVALFMVLSGYLFAKIIDGRSVSYAAFYWNRFVRLAPLLFVVLFVSGVEKYLAGASISSLLETFVSGFIFPIWGNGAWSIATELHFYLALPLVLFFAFKKPKLLLAFLVPLIALRAGIFVFEGSVRDAAYYTIIGRADQFVLGVFAFVAAKNWKPANEQGLIAVFVMVVVCHYLNAKGGYHKTESSGFWIVRPMIEGALAAYFIAAYDKITWQLPRFIGVWAAFIGTISYSIYLWHLMFLQKIKAFELLPQSLIGKSDTYYAIMMCALLFAAMLPLAYLSYRLIEQPFTKLRRPYVLERTAKA